MLDQGYNAEQINLISEYALKLQKEGKSITVEQVQYLLKINSIEEQNKKVIESRSAAEKERTKELEKQQKVLTASSKVQANATKYNFSGLESKYGLPSGTLSAIHAIETGNTGKSNQVNGQTGATGGFQFLAGTAKQYGVKDRTDLAQSAEGAAKYMSYLLKLFKEIWRRLCALIMLVKVMSKKVRILASTIMITGRSLKVTPLEQMDLRLAM